MDACSVLKKAYCSINKNHAFFREKFNNSYYLGIEENEIEFLNSISENEAGVLSASDKMLSYSVAVMYTAALILQEMAKRKKIEYSKEQTACLLDGFYLIQIAEHPFSDKTVEELEEILLGLLTDGIELKARKKTGSERTPNEIVKYMLDLIQYDKTTARNSSIIDPACGTGTFTNQITKRFIESLNTECEVESVKDALINKKQIKAYDTRPSNVYVTKVGMIFQLMEAGLIVNMNEILEFMNNLPVYCDDFLKSKDKADFIVGNPPYIRLQNISKEDRKFIKENFVSATGRFDIYTCFLEKSDGMLNKNGKMCLITSNKYLTTNYGVGIRKYFSKNHHVKKVVDLFDTKFFGAAVLPAITMCQNNTEDVETQYVGIKTSQMKPDCSLNGADELFDFIENNAGNGKSYVQYKNNTIFEIARSKVVVPSDGKTWNFSSREENTVKDKMDAKRNCMLGEIVDVSVGIKTTADKVFVQPMTKEFVLENNFETQVIYPLIQSFNVDKWKISWGTQKKDRYILYPHKENQDGMKAIPLDEIPNAGAYLEKHDNVLKRREYLLNVTSRKWYECWVPQKLSKFKQKKLVTRDIVSSNSFALDEEGRLCQGNTFFLTKKECKFSQAYADLSEHQYFCFLLGILNSRAMEYYQKMISGCLYAKKYRYTTSNLNRWPIPKIDVEIALEISKYVEKIIREESCRKELEKKIDRAVYNAFQFTDDEILKIEEAI